MLNTKINANGNIRIFLRFKKYNFSTMENVDLLFLKFGLGNSILLLKPAPDVIKSDTRNSSASGGIFKPPHFVSEGL